MADNLAISQGVGTTVAADDISSVFYQRVKLSLGADGTAVDAVAGAGAVGTGVQRITLASDDPAVALLTTMDTDTGNIATAVQLLDDAIFTDDAAYTPGTSKLMVIGAEADETAADSVDEGDAGALRMTLARAMHTNLRNSSGTEHSYGAGASGAAVPRIVEAGRAYETVAASQTAQVLGATGATGDTISRVIIIPATTSPGAVDLLDNATSINIFPGGASSVTELKPIVVDLGMVSASGAWKITTGANVSAIGIGSFT